MTQTRRRQTGSCSGVIVAVQKAPPAGTGPSHPMVVHRLVDYCDGINAAPSNWFLHWRDRCHTVAARLRKGPAGETGPASNRHNVLRGPPTGLLGLVDCGGLTRRVRDGSLVGCSSLGAEVFV
jgi:hypothetical protein